MYMCVFSGLFKSETELEILECILYSKRKYCFLKCILFKIFKMYVYYLNMVLSVGCDFFFF